MLPLKKFVVSSFAIAYLIPKGEKGSSKFPGKVLKKVNGKSIILG
jgi:CMP-2-keto-3-deoxyoctulosonic acid synthetase